MSSQPNEPTRRMATVVSVPGWETVDRLILQLPMTHSRFMAVLLDWWCVQQGLLKPEEAMFADEYPRIEKVAQQLLAGKPKK